MTTRTKIRICVLLLLAAALLAVPVQQALALRFGGVGNTPLRDPGWPKGAAVLINTEHRIAYWELDGHWHADCRGDATAFNVVLANFAKVEAKSKLLVVHNGIGQSEWINIGNDPKRREAAKIDWLFTTWTTEDWKRDGNRGRVRRGEKVDPKEAEDGPPAQIDVYTGGNIKWEDVRVPQGIKVVDMRLEAHGFTLADGVVLEGKVVDLVTKKPLSAMMRLERVEPQPKGEHKYVNVAGAVAGAGGHWVLKKAPAGWHRIVIEAPGYVPRQLSGGIFDQPKWQSYDTELVRGALVAGRVTDEAGQPLADVVVRIDVRTEGGGYYAAVRAEPIKTGKDGRFRAEEVPLGKATISVAKAGYNRLGPELSITTPKSDVELTMRQAGRVEVTVDFTGKVRPQGPQGYLVHIDPEGGSKIGSWSGVGPIDDKNQITYENFPPGRYVLTGGPNPGSDRQRTAPATVDVKGGETAKVTLKAK